MFKHNAWFNELPEKVIYQLVGISKIKSLSAGQRLHAKGDQAVGLYCILEGRIRVSNINPYGKETVLTWLESGNWFGEISLFDGLPRTHDAHAEQQTQLLMLPNHRFQHLLQQQPSLYPHFMRLLCQRIRATFSLLDETAALSLKGQLAKRLLLLIKGLSDTNIHQQSLSVTISQESLAYMINSSRQTVNKLLNELKQQGIVTTHYGVITITDLTALEEHTQM